MRAALQACRGGAISAMGFYLYCILAAHGGADGCTWTNAELAHWLPEARSDRRVQQLLAELRAGGLVAVQVTGNARRIHLVAGLQGEAGVQGEAPFQAEICLSPKEQVRLMGLLLQQGYAAEEAQRVLADHIADLRREGIPEARIGDLLAWRVEYATPAFKT